MPSERSEVHSQGAGEEDADHVFVASNLDRRLFHGTADKHVPYPFIVKATEFIKQRGVGMLRRSNV